MTKANKFRRASAPRVTVHANDSVTLSGMTYSDLCSILTDAALHNYDRIDAQEDAESVAYGRKQLHKIEAVEQMQKDALQTNYVEHHGWVTKEQTLKERLQENQRERELIQELMESL